MIWIWGGLTHLALGGVRFTLLACTRFVLPRAAEAVLPLRPICFEDEAGLKDGTFVRSDFDGCIRPIFQARAAPRQVRKCANGFDFGCPLIRELQSFFIGIKSRSVSDIEVVPGQCVTPWLSSTPTRPIQRSFQRRGTGHVYSGGGNPRDLRHSVTRAAFSA